MRLPEGACPPGRGRGRGRAELVPRLTCAQVKMHWVHETYWAPGPQGNDIHKTNVPNLRMRFRYDNHQEEVRSC